MAVKMHPKMQGELKPRPERVLALWTAKRLVWVTFGALGGGAVLSEMEQQAMHGWVRLILGSTH